MLVPGEKRIYILFYIQVQQTSMSTIPYILEQSLRQHRVPEEAIRQFQIASALSNVDGKGFPKELFHLSAPMITRGLLNFAILQMKRDWLYEYLLDYKQKKYIPLCLFAEFNVIV
jgi:hypothetical protein